VSTDRRPDHIVLAITGPSSPDLSAPGSPFESAVWDFLDATHLHYTLINYEVSIRLSDGIGIDLCVLRWARAREVPRTIINTDPAGSDFWEQMQGVHSRGGDWPEAMERTTQAVGPSLHIAALLRDAAILVLIERARDKDPWCAQVREAAKASGTFIRAYELTEVESK
jgi:hypothetical protein